MREHWPDCSRWVVWLLFKQLFYQPSLFWPSQSSSPSSPVQEHQCLQFLSVLGITCINLTGLEFHFRVFQVRTSPTLNMQANQRNVLGKCRFDSVSLGRSLSFHISNCLQECWFVVVPDPHSSMVFTKSRCSCSSALRL